MKKRLSLFILILLPLLASAQTASDAQKSNSLSETRGEEVEPMESLYGEWWLMGWNDGGKWVEFDKKKARQHYMCIEFREDGKVVAYSMVNQIIIGQLTLNGNEMHFDYDGLTTEIFCNDMENIFFEDHIIYIKSYQLDGKQLRLYYTDNDYFVFTKDFNTPQMVYRPFVEDDKVWKVGALNSGNPVQWVEYLYFDGDTIIDGKACKQMMRQRYVSPDFPEYDAISQHPSLNYVGAWYEEDKKVYKYDTTLNQFTMMYDFSLEEGGIFQKDGLSYVIGPRQTGGINGFKGVYRDVMMCGEGGNTCNTTWLESVGNIDGPIYSVYLGKEDHALFLMACAVGDELIYFNDEYEDGATPESAGARKHRFDFTHTTKIEPKTRTRSEAELSLYGEYNEQQLSIHLDPIYDAYLVSIIDESDKVVYEKSINAGNIVGLNIDISSYSKGNYAVTVENDYESFNGTFEAQTTGIMDVRKKVEETGDRIYNLQGQRLNSLQKGLNIVNGQKVFVK